MVTCSVCVCVCVCERVCVCEYMCMCGMCVRESDQMSHAGHVTETDQSERGSGVQWTLTCRTVHRWVCQNQERTRELSEQWGQLLNPAGQRSYGVSAHALLASLLRQRNQSPSLFLTQFILFHLLSHTLTHLLTPSFALIHSFPPLPHHPSLYM